MKKERIREGTTQRRVSLLINADTVGGIIFTLEDRRNPAFRHSHESGDDEGGRVRRFESQERKTIDLLHVHLRIEPFKDFCKRLRMNEFSIETFLKRR